MEGRPRKKMKRELSHAQTQEYRVAYYLYTNYLDYHMYNIYINMYIHVHINCGRRYRCPCVCVCKGHEME